LNKAPIEISDAIVRDAVVVEHSQITGGYRRLSLRVPDIAAKVQPGQFVHLRVPHLRDRILRRPFSVFKAEGDELVVLYKCVGVGTDVLAYAPAGERISLLGPLGTGFPDPAPGSYPVLVGGGYGAGAMYMTAVRSARTGIVFIGGRSAEDILCADDYRELGWELRVTTDDGSLGRRGLVTDELDDWLAEQTDDTRLEIFACGPHPMLKAVGERAIARGCRAWISLDRPMGCGVGACLACVQKIRSVSGEWEYKRTCKEGPVFECRDICWEDET
jgi:dihydroorotate dehydrogenase electron transfer subunit